MGPLRNNPEYSLRRTVIPFVKLLPVWILPEYHGIGLHELLIQVEKELSPLLEDDDACLNRKNSLLHANLNDGL